MKTAVIVWHGFPGIDKPESIKTVQYEDEKQLKAELKRLQGGYSEKGDPKPKIELHELIENGKTRRVIDCNSFHTDFHYVALIGFKIKPEFNKPYEILN